MPGDVFAEDLQHLAVADDVVGDVREDVVFIADGDEQEAQDRPAHEVERHAKRRFHVLHRRFVGVRFDMVEKAADVMVRWAAGAAVFPVHDPHFLVLSHEAFTSVAEAIGVQRPAHAVHAEDVVAVLVRAQRPFNEKARLVVGNRQSLHVVLVHGLRGDARQRGGYTGRMTGRSCAGHGPGHACPGHARATKKPTLADRLPVWWSQIELPTSSLRTTRSPS